MFQKKGLRYPKIVKSSRRPSEAPVLSSDGEVYLSRFWKSCSERNPPGGRYLLIRDLQGSQISRGASCGQGTFNPEMFAQMLRLRQIKILLRSASCTCKDTQIRATQCWKEKRYIIIIIIIIIIITVDCCLLLCKPVDPISAFNVKAVDGSHLDDSMALRRKGMKAAGEFVDIHWSRSLVCFFQELAWKTLFFVLPEVEVLFVLLLAFLVWLLFGMYAEYDGMFFGWLIGFFGGTPKWPGKSYPFVDLCEAWFIGLWWRGWGWMRQVPEYLETYTVDTRLELLNQLSPDSLCQCGAVYVRVLGMKSMGCRKWWVASLRQRVLASHSFQRMMLTMALFFEDGRIIAISYNSGPTSWKLSWNNPWPRWSPSSC